MCCDVSVTECDRVMRLCWISTHWPKHHGLNRPLSRSRALVAHMACNYCLIWCLGTYFQPISVLLTAFTTFNSLLLWEASFLWCSQRAVGEVLSHSVACPWLKDPPSGGFSPLSTVLAQWVWRLACGVYLYSIQPTLSATWPGETSQRCCWTRQQLLHWVSMWQPRSSLHNADLSIIKVHIGQQASPMHQNVIQRALHHSCPLWPA